MNYDFITAKKLFNEPDKSVSLYRNLWKEGSTALLHAPRELDKTGLALSIADEIAAKGRDVLYVNAEGRLNNRKAESDNLFVYNPEFESIDDKTDYADLIFNAIEHAVRTTSIRTFVIDSVSRIAALSFGRNGSVSYIMKRLVALQVKCRLSLLVIADDSTKSVNNSLLALAASEITLQADDSDDSGAVFVGRAGKAEQSLSDALIPMTRQQRRALSRRMAKR